MAAREELCVAMAQVAQSVLTQNLRRDRFGSQLDHEGQICLENLQGVYDAVSAMEVV